MYDIFVRKKLTLHSLSVDIKINLFLLKKISYVENNKWTRNSIFRCATVVLDSKAARTLRTSYLLG